MLDKPTISIVSGAAQDLSATKRTPRSQAGKQAGWQSGSSEFSNFPSTGTKFHYKLWKKKMQFHGLSINFCFSLYWSSVPPVVVVAGSAAAAVAATKGATRRAQTVVPITDLCSPLVFQFVVVSILLSTVSEVNIIFLIAFQFSRFAINLAQVAN